MSATTEITLSVPDISCGHCKQAIEGVVGDLAGVERVEVGIEARTVDVVYGGGTDRGDVIAAIESQGYEVAPE